MVHSTAALSPGGTGRPHSSLPPLTLILGGARSGKSSYAETLAEQSGLALRYLATGRAWDDEMRERINHHQDRRGINWVTHEEPLELADALTRAAAPDAVVLVDCLTLWVTNLMMAERDIDRAGHDLAAGLAALPGPVIFVSNEVGLGIVPDNAMARAFRDHAGRLNQIIAAQCQSVVFIAAGLPLVLKDIR